jgi:hypothetical protein
MKTVARGCAHNVDDVINERCAVEDAVGDKYEQIIVNVFTWVQRVCVCVCVCVQDTSRRIALSLCVNLYK